MRVMVTGGAGFLGSHLCDRLLLDGHQVWCVDNLQTGTKGNIDHLLGTDGFTFIEADVRDAIPDIPVDRLYNLACPASPPRYQADPIGTLRSSILGTLNGLEHCRKVGARFFQASTSEVYGDPTVHPQPETYLGSVNCTGLRACYDEGKRAAETLCFDHFRQYATEVRVGRLFNTYGPRMASDDGRVVSSFIGQAIKGEPITIYGAGAQTRSFCFVADMVEAIVRLMEYPGACIGPMNLGNPVEFTVRELADMVLEKTGHASKIKYLPLPEDDPKVRRPDITLARETLGWTPLVQLSEGLDQTLRWHRHHAERQPGYSPRPYLPRHKVAIIGGGPAGLTAAYRLQELSKHYYPIVLEATDAVGGIARTESYKGYRFDIGGHRFFSKVRIVNNIWQDMLGDEFLRRPRLSRIFYKGKFYAYPLKIVGTLRNLGAYEASRILLSYAKWRVRPHSEETNFEQWVTNRFGGRLFWHFFKTYTEKVWGIPCTEIQADWAAQRIKNLSLRKAVLAAILGKSDSTSLIDSFLYPRLGPGMMWEAFRNRCLAQGGEVRMNSAVQRVYHEDGMITALETVSTIGPAVTTRIEAEHYISSMPIGELIFSLSPPAPKYIRQAAERLRYRDFLIVVLIIRDADLFPDNWIYVHSPEVRVGRIQNFRSWSPEMVPDPDTTSIGMEYFCQEGDDLWQMDNDALIALATSELATLGLSDPDKVVDGTIIRQKKAYPVYDADYRESLNMIRGWLAGFNNLQVVGRNGMHRYNNQDHSMMTALLAAENIDGGNHDLWSVNVEQDYHEDIESAGNIGR